MGGSAGCAGKNGFLYFCISAKGVWRKAVFFFFFFLNY